MSIARYFNPRLRKRLLTGDWPEWLRNHSRQEYIVRCVLASVEWGDARAMNELRKAARLLTQQTGVRHVLDHEIPLTHPYVCGLHIATNIRVVPASVNAFKGNKYNPDQLSLL